jgi:hypothetical protein
MPPRLLLHAGGCEMTIRHFSSTTGRKVSSEAPAKQSWQIGDTVDVGFVSGLEVVKRLPTPGNFAPDAYALWQPTVDRFYRFVPHNGLQRCDNLAEALTA